MAPVFGDASVTSLLSRTFVIFLVILLVSTLSTSYVSAIIQYDRAVLFRIKAHMQDLCVTWDRCYEFFPPKLECQAPSSEYLLLTRRRGRRRKWGSRAGVQVWRRKWRSRGFSPGPNGSRAPGSERCLRPVPVCESDRDAVCASSPVWCTSDWIFPTRPACHRAPRQRALCLVTCRTDQAIQPAPGQPLSRTRSTRIALINARSIANKAFTLNDHFTKENLDFMFITETWQRENEHFHLKELCPPDCSVFGTPRLTRHGGGLTLVFRDSFCCSLTDTASFDSFEMQMCKVGKTHPYYCVLVYRPPGLARTFLDDFSEFLTSIIKLHRVLVLGDFNLHIDDPTCLIAAELLTTMDSFNFVQHVSGHPHKKGHTLDLVVSCGQTIDKLSVEEFQISDHCCISFNLSLIMMSTVCNVVTQKTHH